MSGRHVLEIGESEEWGSEHITGKRTFPKQKRVFMKNTDTQKHVLKNGANYK